MSLESKIYKMSTSAYVNIEKLENNLKNSKTQEEGKGGWEGYENCREEKKCGRIKDLLSKESYFRDVRIFCTAVYCH